MDTGAGSKGDVRHRLRARRREIAASRDLVADAEAIAEVVRASPFAAGTTLSYESLPHEPPTGALNAALQAAGHRVLVPITLPDLHLDWCDLADPGRTPLGTEAPRRAGLAIVPALSVDSAGTRLGQGGGCYDRVLPMLPAHCRVLVLLHPGEHTDEVLPREPHDIPVATVLTALGTTPAVASA
ncbi:5-formyltetrahydrofolate cyclo-ligase [Janibacter sp. GS2]|uniref:5-formyltetrahydrofolate cyclo-ligase n=1 Tax=Janibacter sp. GS2 TaxID=3442646 RepID=UPI003EB8D48B